MRKNGYAKYKEDARRKEDSFLCLFFLLHKKSRKEEHEMKLSVKETAKRNTLRTSKKENNIVKSRRVDYGDN